MLFILSFIFGILGFYYFLLGKREGKITYMISGISMIIDPYFITNLYINIIFGFLLIVIPFIF